MMKLIRAYKPAENLMHISFYLYLINDNWVHGDNTIARSKHFEFAT